jgi:hypothetical protein
MPIASARRLFSLVLVAASASAQAQGLQYRVVAVEPRVIGIPKQAGPVAFGPVQFSFPEGWSFRLAGTIAEGLDGRGSKAFVSVLVSTDLTAGDSSLNEERLAATKRQAAALTDDLCGASASPQPDIIRSEERVVIYASGCDETAKSGKTFVIRYDIYSSKGVVQVTIAGLGAYVEGRSQFDPLATSYIW